jgi:hypothetical protein
MILKIDPADIVCIPKDYNGAKGRCCRYEVVAELNGDPAAAFTAAVNSDYSKTEKAEWPLPGAEHMDGEFPEDEFEIDESFLDDNDLFDEDLFDLVRVNGGLVEYVDMTLEEAQERVQKNAKQKKAALKIVYAGTDEEYED